MSDSLGGNAKTLMFVNVSPASSNEEETLGSLGYATRASLIKNEVKRDEDSAEVQRLKKIIARLSAEDHQGGRPKTRGGTPPPTRGGRG
jgi:kinesin family protein C2/C3